MNCTSIVDVILYVYMYFTISYCFHFNVLLIIKFIVTMRSYMYEFIYVFITWTNSISAGFNVNLVNK
jgi:hypothetical protein